MSDDDLAMLAVQPASLDAFEPFGWIVEPNASTRSANNGTARRSDIHALPAKGMLSDARQITSVFEVKARPADLSISMLERHVNSAQLIAPMGGEGHLVVVCLSRGDGQPDLGTLQAFSFSAELGLIYRQSVWHHPIIAIGRDARFVVQSWQNGTAQDCEIVTIDSRRLRSVTDCL